MAAYDSDPGPGTSAREGIEEIDDEGGDPACWLDRVCPECGLFVDERAALRCPRCGAPMPDA